jgi:NADP-dependent 3-hydroxy acid dehydrogenase YdfG
VKNHWLPNNGKMQHSTFSQLTAEPFYNLVGKKVIITGGTTGIGRATALLLASMKADVVVCGRHEKELNDTITDFNTAGMQNHIHGFTADIATEVGIRKVFENADTYLNGLDILVNNAALPYQGILEGDYKDWQYIINTNLLAYMACAHEAVNRMKSSGQGHIINIGSMSAEVREKGSSVYVATKAGIQAFSEALRKEVNGMGIKVTLIEPGAVGTDMQPISVNEQIKKERKLEMLKAEDIAACIVYTIIQPARCDVVNVQIRPHLQSI